MMACAVADLLKGLGGLFSLRELWVVQRSWSSLINSLTL